MFKKADMFDEYFKLLDALTDDMATAQEVLKKDDTQFNRRTYIHKFFVLLEGELFRRKKIVIELNELFIKAQNTTLAREIIDSTSTASYLNKNKIFLKINKFFGNFFGIVTQTAQIEKIAELILSNAEVALISEEQYDLNHKGDAKSSQKFLKLAENLKFLQKLLIQIIS